jgi:hypothetical protein
VCERETHAQEKKVEMGEVRVKKRRIDWYFFP